MADFIELRLKAPSGAVQTIRATEIISIDGEPYLPAGNNSDVVGTLNHLDGRVTSLEQLLGNFLAAKQTEE